MTGFNKPSKLFLVSVRRFKAACHTVARHLRGQVSTVENRENQTVTNCYAATLKVQRDSVSVLCNHCYPILAFVPAERYGSLRLTFLPSGNIGRAFAELTEFKPLDPAFLQGALTPDMLKDLGPDKLKQLQYWRRGSIVDCIGNVVFNSWD